MCGLEQGGVVSCVQAQSLLAVFSVVLLRTLMVMRKRGGVGRKGPHKGVRVALMWAASS